MTEEKLLSAIHEMVAQDILASLGDSDPDVRRKARVDAIKFLNDNGIDVDKTNRGLTLTHIADILPFTDAQEDARRYGEA